MSKNTDTFDSICGDCAGIDIAEITIDDVRAQASTYGASEDEIQRAIAGLIEYQATATLADFSSYLLDEPAGEYGQYPYALAYEKGDETSRNDEVEIKADKLGVEIEWAGSPDEDEDGNGYWPFRIVA